MRKTLIVQILCNSYLRAISPMEQALKLSAYPKYLLNTGQWVVQKNNVQTIIFGKKQVIFLGLFCVVRKTVIVQILCNSHLRVFAYLALYY